MTETASLGPASASSPAAVPHWRRRLDTSPGVIDTAAARRLYGRTAGWAIQRIARAGDLAARHASIDQAGAAAELLLARVPVQMSDQGEAEGSAAALSVGRAEGEAQPDGSSGSMAHDAMPAAASPVASGLAMRLQRRVAGSGVIKVEASGEIDHKAAGLSLRSGLHHQLAARTGSASAAMHVARRMDPSRGDDVGGDHSITARLAPAGAVPAPNVGGASETGATRHRAASTLHRKVSDGHIDVSTRSMQATGSLARAREAAPLASAQRGIDTMLQLARVSTSDAQPPPPDLFSRSDADAKASLSQPKHDPGASVSAAAATPAARPIIAPAMDAAPLAFSVTQQLSSRPLMLARMPDVGAASTHGAPVRTGSAHVERALGHTVEISIAAPAVPRLVWRTTGDAGTRDRASRFADAGSTGVLMRAGAEAIDGAAAASSASASVPSAIQADAAACAAPAPMPDVNQLAERVTRLIVRRLEVECERRGGKRWN
jgi:hypothetical protein